MPLFLLLLIQQIDKIAYLVMTILIQILSKFLVKDLGSFIKKNDKEAYIVTNNHVINGASKVDIRLSDGTKVPGEIVGADTFSDIAVVKISSEKVTTVAEFGDSSQLTVGETAIAIGSPLGSEYANTVTQGIVSSLNRNVSLKSEDGQAISTKAIQTDTAINPGNSGGPLINIKDKLSELPQVKLPQMEEHL